MTRAQEKAAADQSAAGLTHTRLPLHRGDAMHRGVQYGHAHPPWGASISLAHRRGGRFNVVSAIAATEVPLYGCGLRAARLCPCDARRNAHSV